MTPACSLCEKNELVLVEKFGTLPRVTSDCRPFASGGKLARCSACGFIQKISDADWLEECREIYASYAIYAQGQGQEQRVYSASGTSAFRSDRIAEFVVQHLGSSLDGSVLDVGCGNGRTLKAFSAAFPRALLSGFEIDAKTRDEVMAIPRVQQFYQGEFENVPAGHRLLSAIHVLEHLPEPIKHLEKFVRKLDPDGSLLIEVPEYHQNPFDLVIADHCSHFSSRTLNAVLQRAGFDVIALSNTWVPKELTCLSRPLGERAAARVFAEEPADAFQRSVDFLLALLAEVRDLGTREEIGIFGSSIAAAWVFSAIPDAVRSFVDEDPARVGQVWMGKPIVHPSEVSGARVFFPFPAHLANAIKERVRRQYPNVEIVG